MGKPISLSTFEVMLTANVFTYYAGWCDKITGKTIPAPGNLNLQLYIKMYFKKALVFIPLQLFVYEKVMQRNYLRNRIKIFTSVDSYIDEEGVYSKGAFN